MWTTLRLVEYLLSVAAAHHGRKWEEKTYDALPIPIPSPVAMSSGLTTTKITTVINVFPSSRFSSVHLFDYRLSIYSIDTQSGRTRKCQAFVQQFSLA
jgi:hypothetical protein